MSLEDNRDMDPAMEQLVGIFEHHQKTYKVGASTESFQVQFHNFSANLHKTDGLSKFTVDFSYKIGPPTCHKWTKINPIKMAENKWP